MARIEEDVAALAREAYNSMERVINSDSGKPIVQMRRDAPDWVTDLVREAHGSLLPDNFRYETIRDALDRIADSAGQDENEVSNEFSDEADVYNSDLLEWVGSHSNRPGYVDEARDEFGEPRDFYHGLQMGQYLERGEIFRLVHESLSEKAGNDLEEALTD